MCFFTVGHNQPVLKVTDLELKNDAKQRVIGTGIPRREKRHPAWPSAMAFQRVIGSRDWALEEERVWV